MFKHDHDNIFLNGLKIPVRLFQMLEPSYTFPADLIVMFYDGTRRHYRTQHKSWTVTGSWQDGDRYLSRADEFARLVNASEAEMQEVAASVAAARKEATPEPDLKAKYPEEVTPNVELQQRNDLNEVGTKRVRTTRKRSPRS